MFKVGNLVKIEGTGLKGTILDMPAKKGHYYIDLSGKRMLVPIEQLTLLGDTLDKNSIQKKPNHPQQPKSEQNRTLDLHGLKVKEAEEILLDFINRAVLDGVPMLTIIHGHGMGKIKTMVDEVLTSTRIAKAVKPSEDGRASVIVYL